MNLLPPWARRSAEWSAMTSGDGLYRQLLENPGAWDLSDDAAWSAGLAARSSTLPHVVAYWKTYVAGLSGHDSSTALRRWTVLAEMLWAFDRARRFEELPAHEIDRVALAHALPVIDGVHLFARSSKDPSPDAARAYIWIRSFRQVERQARTAVPIALYQPTTGDGFLATLELELMPGGLGEVAAHPAQAFDTIAHAAFAESIAQAWKMALEELGGAQRFDGRWRVRRGPPHKLHDGHEIELVDGSSASGAAARGWWHVLRNQVPDPEVVVLAQVSGDGRSLEPVDLHLIPQKVRAIVADGALSDGQPTFDTIVVVGDRSRREAERALGDRHRDFRVVAL